MKNWFNNYSRPHFGVLVTWMAIYIAVTKSPQKLPEISGVRAGGASVISFLPEEVLSSSAVFQAARGILLAAGALWACHLLVPISSWLTALSFTFVVACAFENSDHVSHTYHVCNIVMLIHALWYQFYAKEMAQALKQGVFWQTEVYPQWVFSASVLYIGLYHTFAGISKLAWSGLGWADGTSLQLWTHLFGQQGSFVTELLISNRSLAAALQVGTLVIETGAVLAICSRRLRMVIGLALLGFYAGVILNFGFRFRFNALLVGLFFLPCDTWINALYQYVNRFVAVNIRLASVPKRVEELLKAVLYRLDAFQCVRLDIGTTTLKPLRLVGTEDDAEQFTSTPAAQRGQAGAKRSRKAA